MPAGRKSNRLIGYDYAQPGAYFVTVCVKNRKCVLSTIEDGYVHLSNLGYPVERSIEMTQRHFLDVSMDSFVIMPNHLHAIIIHEASIPRRAGVTPPLPKKESLGQIVAYFKYHSAKAINQYLNTPGQRFWQRNYYDRVIRNEIELNRLRKYILDNPLCWETDR